MRRAAKVDANQASIREYLEAHGCQVVSTAALGNGFPDLMACWGEHVALVEVKDGHGKLRERQAEFIARWPMTKIVRSESDAEALVAWLKRP